MDNFVRRLSSSAKPNVVREDDRARPLIKESEHGKKPRYSGYKIKLSKQYQNLIKKVCGGVNSQRSNFKCSLIPLSPSAP
jgi:hypothetical protein